MIVKIMTMIDYKIIINIGKNQEYVNYHATTELKLDISEIFFFAF